MKDFIKSLFNDSNIIDFNYGDFDTLYTKDNKYDAYYLWFFLSDIEELKQINSQYDKVYNQIKNIDRKSYASSMDKNTTCVFCLCIENDEYYKFNKANIITNLDKTICDVEENLMFFKKNVFVYTNDMKEFARVNVGRLREICSQYFNVQHYNDFKQDLENNYQYDFLANLFIKLPFLNFSDYFNMDEVSYLTIENSINKECSESQITAEMIKENNIFIDKIEECVGDEKALFTWLDSLGGENNEHQN